MGNLLCVYVRAGNIHDTKDAVYTFKKTLYRYPTLFGVSADQGYRGVFKIHLSFSQYKSGYFTKNK